MPARTAYRQLQAIRDRLPQYRPHPRPPQLAENILGLADAYDAHWVRAFRGGFHACSRSHAGGGIRTCSGFRTGAGRRA